MIEIIIVPQGAEYRAVKKGLKKVASNQPQIITIPIGVKHIEQNLTKNNFWKYQPKKVLMMGLCGSLSSQYTVGDTVLYRDCYYPNTQEKLLTDALTNQIIAQKIKTYKIVTTSSLTSDRIITTIPEKQQLAQDFAVNVVDMESFAYLKLLQQKAIAVSIIRVVSDDLQFSLPNLEQTIDEEGNIKPLTMTRKMLQQPIKSLNFIQSSLKSLKKLEQITLALFSD